MRRPARLLAPVFLAILALSTLAPVTEAATVRFPAVSFGNRGSDVRSIQATLISKGYTAPFDGVFSGSTRDAVKSFQTSRGLKATGIVEDLTWKQLLSTVQPGTARMPILVLQRQLNEKLRAGVPVDGVYGASTKAAVIAFQRHMRLPANGIVGWHTWQALLWHYELPAFNATTLCDYTVGNGRANWATGSAIGQLEAAAATIAAAGLGRIAVGDAGFEHGGDIPGHMTHEVGMDIDIRPIRDDENQCRYGTNYRFATYDRTATRALVRAIRATASGHVKLIYFNDPVLIKEGLVQPYTGHDDHLHIRYCAPGFPDPAYRC